MVNRTDKEALTIRGSNPQYLVDYTVRKKVYDFLFWKENCFGISAETLIDKAVRMNYVGGTYGGSRKPTEFICLILKILQIQPEKKTIFEYIINKEYKSCEYWVHFIYD